MTCRELIAILDDYLSDSLEEAERLSLESHLVLCANCRNYLDSYRRTIQLTRQAGKTEDFLPLGVPPELRRAVRPPADEND